MTIVKENARINDQRGDNMSVKQVDLINNESKTRFQSSQDVIDAYLKHLSVDDLKKLSTKISVSYLEQKMDSFFNKEFYSENIKAYEKFLQFVAYTVKKIGIAGNSISYSIVIENLLKDGYLSIDNKYSYSSDEETYVLDLSGCLGINVINGYGCCEHEAAIHSEIFKYLKLVEYKICCLLDSRLSFQDGIGSFANHMVNVLEYGDTYIVHDITNHSFFRFRDGYIMEEYTNEQDIYGEVMYYKPLSDVICNTLDPLSVVQKIVKFNEVATKSELQVDELTRIVNETNHLYKENKSLLNDLQKELKKHIRNIIPTKIR